MARAIRLTHPQIELLADLATHPQMYVRTFSREAKTAQALVRHGLATMSYAEGCDEVVITQAGRTEAARRGIGAA